MGDVGPVHDLMGGEEAEELLFAREFGVAGVGLDAMEEVGLFVVVGGEEDVPGDALECLLVLACAVAQSGGSPHGLELFRIFLDQLRV